MFFIVSEHVFPFLREMGGKGTAHAGHMKDARFTIPTPGLLAKVVDMLEDIPLEACDQGRPLRIHAGQDCQRRPERPVPHAAPYHQPDGGIDRPDTA
ncbi:hypothetical protein [Pannonibacter indicus]|uniref:hypothetical protein n=1 Tax=Pannonibacter indicus TaxID=466044 RepID=UPI00391CED1A